MGNGYKDKELIAICLKQMEREEKEGIVTNLGDLIKECQQFLNMRDSLDQLNSLTMKNTTAVKFRRDNNRQSFKPYPRKSISTCFRCGKKEHEP